MSALPAPRPTPDPGFRTGVVRGISYGLFGPPTAFAEAAAGLGVGLIRAYVYWSQVEPEEGRFDFAVLDRLLDDLDTHGMDLWLTVCSSSPWATRVPTSFQPQSPALDATRYGRFVQAVVRRCAGRVKYWQSNNEPSNTGLLWDGTAEEYVAQLRVFYDAVRRESPAAEVVLGGCGYDYLSSEPGSPPRQFFEVLVQEGREAFDLFSVHLYDDPARIPAHLEDVRSLMRKSGSEKPVVVGEYAGPSLFELPEALAALETAMITAFGDSDQAEPPDRRAMRQLYDRLDELPDGIRMFLEGPPPELEALRERVACRQMVTRNVLALAAGAGLTVCWNLAPEIPHYRDRLNMLGFLSGTFALLDFDDDGELTRERPAAATLRMVSRHLTGARGAKPMPTDDPALSAYAIETADGKALHVLWREGDLLRGETSPPVRVAWPWLEPTAVIEDAFGARDELATDHGRVTLSTSVTPLLVSSSSRP